MYVLSQNVGKLFVQYFFLHSLEKFSLEVRTLILNLYFLGENAFTHTFTFEPCYLITHMKMAHLSWTSPNMSSIGEVPDRLSKTLLMSLVGNHWATGGL